ncbi:AMP-binding protein [Mesorhizobium sp. BAC0120]|uniref:AMP-binding protein n=1 Tax=Mesorhizobium sp. BAC0120 TaxID=3090670 RepID=UPI00298C6BC0|nr:AMP-binding protein [Mesorhizobium sp. BAC0120]MDW6021845.1 AMP-binding protein [Mesorhizobium sp. BAC0120]
MEDKGFISCLQARAAASPDAIYATFDGEPISFADLHRKSDSVAVELRRLGVAKGDRVALMLRNSPDSLAVLFAIAKCGAVWVPVNVQLRGDGLKYILEHSEPRVVFANRDLFPNVLECGADTTAFRLVAETGAPDSLDRLVAGGHVFSESLPGADDLFALNYTSGTTGRPKGVCVTHRMLRYASEGAMLCSDARDGDVFFVWEPLYHIGGAQLIPIPLLRDVRLSMVQRFSASRFWDDVRECGATQIHYLGGVLQILLKQPESARDRDHKVRVAWGGGCPRDIWRAFEERFGIPLRECYGMTESSSITTFNATGVLGSVGMPVPWLSVEILDDQGKPVAAGASGEIVVHPRQEGAVFAAYFRNEEATAKALRPNGFHTGDLGMLDASDNLYFLGRLTDSVRVKGENVSAFEVEHVAGGHPLVEDCALIGVKAEVGEQEIKLFIKPKAGADIDYLSFSDWLAQRLAPFQNPRYLAVIDDFERTPSQRIMKHRLPTSVEGSWDRLQETGR